MWGILLTVATLIPLSTATPNLPEVLYFQMEIHYSSTVVQRTVPVELYLTQDMRWKWSLLDPPTLTETVVCDGSNLWRSIGVGNGKVIAVHYVNLKELQKEIPADKVRHFAMTTSFGLWTLADPQGINKRWATPLVLKESIRSVRGNRVLYT